MKTPRIFILFGALALVLTIASQTLESTARPAAAESLPIMRADPWAGDPDEPGMGQAIPFEEESSYTRTDVSSTTSSQVRTSKFVNLWRSHVRWLALAALSLGGRR